MYTLEVGVGFLIAIVLVCCILQCGSLCSRCNKSGKSKKDKQKKAHDDDNREYGAVALDPANYCDEDIPAHLRCPRPPEESVTIEMEGVKSMPRHSRANRDDNLSILSQETILFESLETLRQLGFVNETQNVEALRLYQGDMGTVIQRLLETDTDRDDAERSIIRLPFTHQLHSRKTTAASACSDRERDERDVVGRSEAEAILPSPSSRSRRAMASSPKVKLVVSSPKRRQMEMDRVSPRHKVLRNMQPLIESPVRGSLPVPDTPKKSASPSSASLTSASISAQAAPVYTVGQKVLVVPVGHHPLRLSAVITEKSGSWICIKYDHFVYADDEDSERLHIVDDAERIVSDLDQDLMNDSEMEQLHNAMSRRCTSVGTVMSMASAVSMNVSTTAAATRGGVERECVVCMAEHRSFACIPCGHLCLCGKCKDELFDKTCPICQQPYDCFIKIYS